MAALAAGPGVVWCGVIDGISSSLVKLRGRAEARGSGYIGI